MSRRPALVVAIALASAVQAAAAPPRARRCQDAVAFAGRRLFARALAVLASCEGMATPRSSAACVASGSTSRRLVAAAERPARVVRRSCTDADVASIGFAADCDRARTVKDLVGCLRASHEGAAERLLAATRVAGGTSGGAERCATMALKQGRRSALRRLELLQTCKRSPERFGVIPGMSCADAPVVVQQLGRRDARAAERIAAACRPIVRHGLRLPCNLRDTADDAARCVLGTAGSAADTAVAAEHPDPGFCGDDGAAVERRLDELLGQLTFDEKIEQMHGIGFADGAWRTPGVERLGIPGFAMIDGPRGVSLEGGSATDFPVAMARGATWDPALEGRVGDAIGVEARAKGASVLLAPTLNILRHPRWGRAQETYGEDTVHLGRMGVGFIRGAQRHVVATAKHFAVNSIEDTRLVLDVSVDERSLREVYLPHFRMAVQQGHVGAVMAAYNKVNGHYCAENVHLLRDILDGDWRFRGFVESDWYVGTHSTGMSAIAGLDIEMPLAVYYGEPLAAAVEEGGEVPMGVIDEAVRRIMRVQLCFRLDTDPPVPDPSAVQTPAHLDLALEAERASIVLLRNERAMLPLDRTQIASIVVVGDLAGVASLGDLGSSVVAPSFAVTPLDGIRALAGDVAVTHVPGPPLSADDRAMVAAADAAIVIAGLSPGDEGEAGGEPTGDRITLGLSPEQDELIAAVAAANPHTIVVLEASGVITMPWVDDVSAILMAWYPGQMGGQAIAEVLFGDVNPSGRLPMTFPRSDRDLPPFDNTHAAVRYGYTHGYRWLDRWRTEPLFPFGFGLSYTAFRYSNLTLSRATLAPDGQLLITVDVTNIGGMAGDEVVQLYVSYVGSRVERDVKDLKAFARVHLAPGETRTVPLELRAADLAYWDTSAGGWRVEPIRYRVHVGSSSRTLPLVGAVTVAER